MRVSFFADVDSITNKRGTQELVVKFVTQEVSDEQAGAMMSLRNKYTNVLISTEEISQEDADEQETEFKAVPVLETKTNSQRLRNALYVLWESKYKQRYPLFDRFYDYYMNLLIEEVKDKI